MSCCSFRNNFTNLLKIFELISLPLASLFPGRAENKLFIFYLSPDNSSELCCGSLLFSRITPPGPGNRPFTGRTGFEHASGPADRPFTGRTGLGRTSGPADAPFRGQRG